MTVKEIPDESAAAFLGPRASYYLARWQRADAAPSPLLGFHWPAFFLGMGWLLYRRMYRYFWIALGATVGGSILLGMLFPEPPPALEGGVSIAIAISFGQFANYWYLLHAKRLYREAPARFVDRGGVRWWPPLLFAGVIFGFVLLVLWAAKLPIA